MSLFQSVADKAVLIFRNARKNALPDSGKRELVTNELVLY